MLLGCWTAQSQQQEVSLRPSLLFGNDPAPLVSSHPPLQPVMAVLVLQQWVERMLEMKLICRRTRRRCSWMQVSVITRQSVRDINESTSEAVEAGGLFPAGVRPPADKLMLDLKLHEQTQEHLP